MNRRILAGAGAFTLRLLALGTPAYPQQSPKWFIQPKPAPVTAAASRAVPAAQGDIPPCSHSPVCGNRIGPSLQEIERVGWEQNLGFTHSYPFDLPEGGGGVSGVGIDSKGNVWAFQRNAPGKPSVFEFAPNGKLLRSIGDDVIGHQEKAHGVTVDADDNVWICDANSATVMKLSSEGHLLMTLGVKGQRGDWVEAKGQRLLWQPLTLAFAPNGDIYIAEGHANESPNDTGLSPTNTLGAARIIHLDKTGKYLGQWYGNSAGQGKFEAAHGIAVEPGTGNIWICDRDQYRLVVYSAEGKFLRTIQMRNLTCAIGFDAQGNLWVASGRDGQILKVDRNGNTLGAVGAGAGLGSGQFFEASYMVWDRQGSMYVADTVISRVTKFSPK